MTGARRLDFASLAGWDEDDHAAALAAFSRTAALLPAFGAIAPPGEDEDARTFFETRFEPVLIGDPPALLTGYYEPEIDGRRAAEPGFSHPLYAPPPGLPAETPWLSRAEIEETDALAGRELVWLASAAEAFFAQVQGSARVRLPEGEVLRLGFAGRNGHPYRSVGQELIRRGEIAEGEISAQAIRRWLATHPDEERLLLRHNASFVFFRIVENSNDLGPIGSAGAPVTALRSLAVDAGHLPLGLPVWIETYGDQAFHRLMIVQDTGTAIRGAQRGDIFFGTGDMAGDEAGRMREPGRIVALMPRGFAQGVVA